jgi:hypothetical protein
VTERQRSRPWAPPKFIGFENEPIQLVLEGFEPPVQLTLEGFDNMIAAAPPRENLTDLLGSEASSPGRSVLVTFHDDELVRLNSLAEAAGLSLSAYIRACALGDPRPQTRPRASLNEDLRAHRSARFNRLGGKSAPTSVPLEEWLARYYPEDSITAAKVTPASSESDLTPVPGADDTDAVAVVVSSSTHADAAILTTPVVAARSGDPVARARVTAKLADIVAGLIPSRKLRERDEIGWHASADGGERPSHELLRS